MQVNDEDLATLIKLQESDKELLRVQKEIAGLPQRKTIVALRKKIAAIEEKQAKVAGMKAAAEEKLAKLSDEDAKLAAKQETAQKAIDDSKGYRDVEARTKELAGYAKRRDTLVGELDSLGAELAKIEGVAAQIEAALGGLKADEAKEVASFQKQGGALKLSEAKLTKMHEALAAKIPEELAASYEKAAKRGGGVGLAVLSEGTCGACRGTIEGGRLIDLKAKAPLGECPHCKRLLIVTK